MEDFSTTANNKTFRLRGIYPGESEKDVRKLVQSRILRDDSKYSFTVHSLAPDPYRPKLQMATVDFSKLPKFAEGNIKKEWAFKRSNGEPLVLDTHFDGFTALHTPNASSWTVDIIAICGLNGHAHGSFKDRDGPFMWLRDILPIEIPGDRIMTYGYDTSLVHSESFQTVIDLGTRLRGAMLDHLRWNNQKPLILLGHGLGGLVMKNAIIEMKEANTDQDKMTLASIRGLLFFGVPNQGMNIESLVPVVGNNVNRGFLESLRPNSDFLLRQSSKFSRIVRSDLANCSIVSFYETGESPTAEWNKNKGKWEMTGRSTILVPQKSATICLPQNHGSYKEVPIPRSHIELVKFHSRSDKVFLSVLSEIASICDKAK